MKSRLAILRVSALTLLSAALFLRTARVYRTVFEILPVVRNRSFESYFRPGLIEAVRAIRKTRPEKVYALFEYEQDRYLYERLGELLYPVTLAPVSGAVIGPDDICAAPAYAPLPDPSAFKTVRETESVRILKKKR